MGAFQAKNSYAVFRFEVARESDGEAERTARVAAMPSGWLPELVLRIARDFARSSFFDVRVRDGARDPREIPWPGTSPAWSAAQAALGIQRRAVINNLLESD